MTVDEEGNTFTCASGRQADYGGRWLLPCHIPYSKNVHRLITAELELTFCDTHMFELIEAGLITDPFISEEGARKLVEDDIRLMRRTRPSRPLFGPWREP